MELKKKHGAVDYDSGTSARCKVCGGRSTGVHYGVISCEGCKAFYKRGIINGIKYKCYFGSTCPVTAGTRGRRCKACRFRRCQEEGMDVRAVKGSRSWRSKDEKSETSPAMADDNNPDKDYAPDQDDSMSWSTVIMTPLKEFSSEPGRTSFSTRSFDGSADSGSSVDSGGAHRSTELVPVNPRASFGLLDKDSEDFPAITVNLFSSWMLSGLFPVVSPDWLETSDRSTMPKFLGNYVRAMFNRNLFLVETINKVQHAIDCVISKLANKFESYQSHPSFLQKDASLETERRVLRALQHDIGNNSLCFKLFLQTLPGFAELDPQLLQKLIPQRYLNFWVFFHSSFYYNNADREVYILADIELDQRAYLVDKVCEKEYADYVYRCVLDIRQLQLDDVMRYLLLVVSILHPIDPRFPADDRAALEALHAHYLDALMHYVSGLSQGRQMVTALQQFFTRIPTMNQVSELYVTQLDFGSLPLCMASGQTFTELFNSILRKRDQSALVNRFHADRQVY
ncbi:mineralocorticoid receptor-like isoform X2 [Paramacrobiotus metropolitanus]|uniref:mineralocorticoid receptor-like isoform X2 n=1 Tax=Paramacrobiotus metropolitanus TaxID=2943436 RepID=UPI0024465569|nr:mineralocorticoid receptor-like isoform X2 [Paramacrobiotus metropolitanus]